MLIRQGIRNNLSRTAASVALTLFISLAAPVTAQALAPAPLQGASLASHFAATKKSSKKKKTSKKKTSKPATTRINLSPVNPGGLPRSQANTSTIKTILQLVFGIIGAFALMSMTASGLKYVTSGGDPGKTSEAKKGIVFALIGLMLAISAEAIVAFVIKRGAP